MAPRIESREDQRDYIVAGDSIFTLSHTRRFTFHVHKPREQRTRDGQPTVLFVEVLAGPDNTADYQYLGTLAPLPSGQDGDGQRRVRYAYRHGAKSRLSPGCPAEAAFAWAWRHLEAGQSIEPAEFWYSGACSRCGRLLTTPESLARGVGPECAAKGAR